MTQHAETIERHQSDTLRFHQREERTRSNGQGQRVAERHVDEALRPGYPLSKSSPPLHQGARTRVGYAGARNGLNFRSALAAKTKSLSVRPLILCDQISIMHSPRPDTDQDDGPRPPRQPQPCSQMPSPVESSATGSCFNNSCEDPSTGAHCLHHYMSCPPVSSESPLNCSRCRVHLLRRTGWITGLISGWTTCSLSGRRSTGGGRR